MAINIAINIPSKYKIVVNGSINVNKLLLNITFLLGILSTMPIVGISFAGHFISGFSTLFIVFFGLLALLTLKRGNMNSRFSISEIFLLLFMAWTLTGFVMGYFILPNVWHTYTIKYAIKIVEYIALFILIHFYNNEELAEKFVKGLLIGCVINCIWCILQGLVYLLFHKFLNEMLFPSSGGEVWTQYGGIRAGGLNYDPANIGVLLPIVLFYALKKKKIYLFAVCAFSLVFSQSTTAMVGSIFISTCYFCFFKRESNTSIDNSNKKKKHVTIVIIMGILILILIAIKQGLIGKIYEGINGYIQGFLRRMDENYVSASDKGPREIYYKNFIRLLFKRNILFIIFGSGIGTSMYVYSEFEIFGIVGVDVFGEIEATYLAYLFDCGIVGLALFLGFLFVTIKQLYRKTIRLTDDLSIIMTGFMLSVLLSNIFYHYIIAANQMLAFMFICTYLKSNTSYMYYKRFLSIIR